jgi:hypothetical protein
MGCSDASTQAGSYVPSTEMLDDSTSAERDRESISAGQRHYGRTQPSTMRTFQGWS